MVCRSSRSFGTLCYSPGRGWLRKAVVSTTVFVATTSFHPSRGLRPGPDVSTSREMPTGFSQAVSEYLMILSSTSRAPLEMCWSRSQKEQLVLVPASLPAGSRRFPPLLAEHCTLIPCFTIPLQLQIILIQRIIRIFPTNEPNLTNYLFEQFVFHFSTLPLDKLASISALRQLLDLSTSRLLDLSTPRLLNVSHPTRLPVVFSSRSSRGLEFISRSRRLKYDWLLRPCRELERRYELTEKRI